MSDIIERVRRKLEQLKRHSDKPLLFGVKIDKNEPAVRKFIKKLRK